jgi:DNA polymerase-4
MERVILHSDINNCFASIEAVLDPSLKGKAVAVCGSQEDRHGIVLAKSEQAKKYGVYTGQTAYQAKRICPDLIVVPPHLEEYLKFSARAQRLYSDYTDRVEPFGLDECWLDVTASRRLFGSGEDIACTIKERMKQELGVTVSIGVSFNKIFAKLGSDMKKPDAVTEITESNFKEKVWPLPCSDLLYCGRATTAKLAGICVRTIGDLARLQPDTMKRKFGKNRR